MTPSTTPTFSPDTPSPPSNMTGMVIVPPTSGERTRFLTHGSLSFPVMTRIRIVGINSMDPRDQTLVGVTGRALTLTTSNRVPGVAYTIGLFVDQQYVRSCCGGEQVLNLVRGDVIEIIGPPPATGERVPRE